VGVRADFSGFNPIVTTDQYGIEVNQYVLFTPLVQYDEDLNARPYLAESWELLGDTGVVFRLRRDVRWHDGRPVTAEDVAFTFERAKDPRTASLLASAFLEPVRSAEVLDAHTIRFRFVRPHAQALEDFWWAPVPRHLLADVPPDRLRTAAFNRRPVGSGPYRFVEWRPNERVVFERNPDFPEGLGGPPYLDRVVFRVIPESATMLTELLTGGVDVDIPLLPDQVAQVRANDALQLFAFPGRTVYYIGWNNRRPPFTRAAVRRALALGIDREQIVNALLFGHGTLATSTIPPWHPFYPEDVDPLPYDPAEAARLLAAEGWADRTGDGVREGPDGRPLRFALLTSDASLNRAVAEVVQNQLRRIGAAVEVQVREFQTVLAQHKARDFDAVLTTWVLDNFQAASAPMALFHSRWAAVPLSANRSGYANPRADSLIERGAAATDPDEARRVWRDFVLLMNEEQPVTFLFWLDELAAARRRVQGIEMDPRGELLSIGRWWVAGGGVAAARE